MIDLRCTCSARPILGKAHEVDGRWVLHIKVYKRQAIYAEVLVESGSRVRIRCRSCGRWFLVNVRAVPRAVRQELPPSMNGFTEKIEL